MKAIRLHGRGGPDHLIYEDAPDPQPGPGEVLVRVAATAIIANELYWDLTYQQPDGTPRPTPIPGRDVAGTVAALGAGVTDLAIGTAVYGLLAFGRDGAAADFAIARPDELAPMPRTLDAAHAAVVPLSALTAWQALFPAAGLVAGQTVLIHGAAGGVGTYALQLAHWTGARVIVTASARQGDFLRDLGADVVIDYTTTRFEDAVPKVDVVVDLVGGATLARSWAVVKPGGTLVSVVSPPPDVTAHDGVRFRWFIVTPSGAQLREIGALLDGGQVRPIVDAIFPLADARAAYEASGAGHARGKIVLKVAQ